MRDEKSEITFAWGNLESRRRKWSGKGRKIIQTNQYADGELLGTGPSPFGRLPARTTSSVVQADSEMKWAGQFVKHCPSARVKGPFHRVFLGPSRCEDAICLRPNQLEVPRFLNGLFQPYSAVSL